MWPLWADILSRCFPSLCVLEQMRVRCSEIRSGKSMCANACAHMLHEVYARRLMRSTYTHTHIRRVLYHHHHQQLVRTAECVFIEYRDVVVLLKQVLILVGIAHALRSSFSSISAAAGLTENAHAWDEDTREFHTQTPSPKRGSAYWARCNVHSKCMAAFICPVLLQQQQPFETD